MKKKLILLLKSSLLCLTLVSAVIAQDNSEPGCATQVQEEGSTNAITAYQAMCVLAVVQSRIEPMVMNGVSIDDAQALSYVLEQIYAMVDYCKEHKQLDAEHIQQLLSIVFVVKQLEENYHKADMTHVTQ